LPVATRLASFPPHTQRRSVRRRRQRFPVCHRCPPVHHPRPLPKALHPRWVPPRAAGVSTRRSLNLSPSRASPTDRSVQFGGFAHAVHGCGTRCPLLWSSDAHESPGAASALVHIPRLWERLRRLAATIGSWRRSDHGRARLLPIRALDARARGAYGWSRPAAECPSGISQHGLQSGTA
jgi:hypothetical protein